MSRLLCPHSGKLHTPISGRVGSLLIGELKTPHATWCGLKNFKIKRKWPKTITHKHGINAVNKLLKIK